MVYLTEIRIHDETSGRFAPFKASVNCVLKLFARLIKRKLITQNVRTVNVYVNLNPETHFSYTIKGGSVTIYYDFSQLNYSDSDTFYKRKKVVLDIIYNVLGYVASNETWDIDVVMDTYNKCLELKIQNEWWFKDKLFTSPGRLYKAGLYHIYDIDTFEIYIVLLDKNKNELIRHLIFKDQLNTFEIQQFSWIDKDKITYKFKGPDKKFVYSVQDLLNSHVNELPEKIDLLFQ